MSPFRIISEEVIRADNFIHDQHFIWIINELENDKIQMEIEDRIKID